MTISESELATVRLFFLIWGIVFVLASIVMLIFLVRSLICAAHLMQFRKSKKLVGNSVIPILTVLGVSVCALGYSGNLFSWYLEFGKVDYDAKTRHLGKLKLR